MNTDRASHLPANDAQWIDELFYALFSRLPGYDPSWLETAEEPPPPIPCFSELSPDAQLNSFHMELLLPESVANYLMAFDPNETLSKSEHHALELAIMKHHGIYDCTGFAVCLQRTDSGFHAVLLPDNGSDDCNLADALVVPPEPRQ